MSKAFGIAFAATVAVIGVLIWFGFAKTEGNHLAPTGSIGKVRTVQSTDDVTFMVLDFKIKNDSDRNMIVHSVQTAVDTADGATMMGSGVAARDVANAFKSFPELGEIYNPVLKERDIVPAHQSVDRMVGVRIGAPLAKVESRKRVVLRVEDVTGPVVELTK